MGEISRFSAQSTQCCQHSALIGCRPKAYHWPSAGLSLLNTPMLSSDYPRPRLAYRKKSQRNNDTKKSQKCSINNSSKIKYVSSCESFNNKSESFNDKLGSLNSNSCCCSCCDELNSKSLYAYTGHHTTKRQRRNSLRLNRNKEIERVSKLSTSTQSLNVSVQSNVPLGINEYDKGKKESQKSILTESCKENSEKFIEPNENCDSCDNDGYRYNENANHINHEECDECEQKLRLCECDKSDLQSNGIVDNFRNFRTEEINQTNNCESRNKCERLNKNQGDECSRRTFFERIKRAYNKTSSNKMDKSMDEKYRKVFNLKSKNIGNKRIENDKKYFQNIVKKSKLFPRSQSAESCRQENTTCNAFFSYSRSMDDLTLLHRADNRCNFSRINAEFNKCNSCPTDSKAIIHYSISNGKDDSCNVLYLSEARYLNNMELVAGDDLISRLTTNNSVENFNNIPSKNKSFYKSKYYSSSSSNFFENNETVKLSNDSNDQKISSKFSKSNSAKDEKTRRRPMSKEPTSVNIKFLQVNHFKSFSSAKSNILDDQDLDFTAAEARRIKTYVNSIIFPQSKDFKTTNLTLPTKRLSQFVKINPKNYLFENDLTISSIKYSDMSGKKSSISNCITKGINARYCTEHNSRRKLNADSGFINALFDSEKSGNFCSCRMCSDFNHEIEDFHSNFIINSQLSNSEDSCVIRNKTRTKKNVSDIPRNLLSENKSRNSVTKYKKSSKTVSIFSTDNQSCHLNRNNSISIAGTNNTVNVNDRRKLLIDTTKNGHKNVNKLTLTDTILQTSCNSDIKFKSADSTILNLHEDRINEARKALMFLNNGYYNTENNKNSRQTVHIYIPMHKNNHPAFDGLL